MKDSLLFKFCYYFNYYINILLYLFIYFYILFQFIYYIFKFKFKLNRTKACTYVFKRANIYFKLNVYNILKLIILHLCFIGLEVATALQLRCCASYQ